MFVIKLIAITAIMEYIKEACFIRQDSNIQKLLKSEAPETKKRKFSQR
jgi:hypothetical protein